MWTEGQIAYLAGIIDGEGCIYIQRRKTKCGWSYFPRFQVTNTNRNLMEWIKNTFGGLIYDKPRKHINPKWKMQIEWFTTRELLDKLLIFIIPYLVIKRKQAEIMIEFRNSFKKTKRGQTVPEDIQDYRLSCMNKIKELNQHN
jgi:hypothetical protein